MRARRALIGGRLSSLPHFLMGCPACLRSLLTWDGHAAWRCRRCGYGMTLARIVDVGERSIDLPFCVSVGSRPMRLPLTGTATLLCRRGILNLSGTRNLLETPWDADADAARHDAIRDLMDDLEQAL